MRIPRRQFLQLTAGATAMPVLLQIASAQTYPLRPVRIIVPFAPAGATDITARLIGQWLSERLGQTFVIENRPGGSGNVGMQAVVNAPPDGYTLLLVGASAAINATLFEKLNFNFVNDIAPVAGINSIPLIVEVNPAVPAKTIPEFIAHAKANPGKINMASGGSGGAGHMAGELFKKMAGVELVHVPYRGAGLALSDMIGGQVQVMFDPIPSSVEYVRSGKLRALAVTTAKRSEVLSELPPVSDFVPGYEVSAWQGIGAPRNTSAEIVNKLNREINAAFADPKMKARLAGLGTTPMPFTPVEFGSFMKAETEKWAKVVKFSGAKPD
jgi:tripartite-type tricarboxylate transporter receptor subunit TctC